MIEGIISEFQFQDRTTEMNQSKVKDGRKWIISFLKFYIVFIPFMYFVFKIQKGESDPHEAASSIH